MHDIFIQTLIVCGLAIAAWWITDRFAPDPLLDKLVKLAIFVGMVIWIITTAGASPQVV